MSERVKPSCLIKEQQTNSHISDDKRDVGIALAALQSALAELTKLRLALANSENELKLAREIIVIATKKLIAKN